MCDMMQFPDNVYEFMEKNKIVDTDQVYTNGAELVPIFRMKQWFEHLKGTSSIERTERNLTTTDVVEAIDILTRMSTNHFYGHREQEAFKLGAEALKQRWIPVKQKEKLKRCVESEDLFPDLPQIIKDKNTEIIKAYKEGYEQGEKDAERQEQITSEMDEIFRIASEIRLAVGCNTSHECCELAQRGDIQRVKHGRWIHRPVEEWGASNCKCSICGAEYFFPLLLKGFADNYCGNCGAKMEK